MLKNLAGPVITALIVGGVGLILFLNLNPGTASPGPHSLAPVIATKPAPAAPAPPGAKPKGFREYPIGDEVEANHLKVAAVWLPSIAMDGSGLGGTDVIHVEADVQATEGNPHGFALGEFVPYLKVHYKVLPAGGGAPVHQGDMVPMVAADGLHYGVSLAMPKAGSYRLVYAIEPPSAGGLGRHSDPATGVAPWWAPFEVGFDWDYPGPPK